MLYQYKLRETILFIIHCHCLLFTATIYLNLVQFCVAIFKENIPYLFDMMQTSGAIFPHHLNQIKPSLCQDVIPGPTYLAGFNLRSSSETVRLPSSADSQLSNPKSGFMCPSPGFSGPIVTSQPQRSTAIRLQLLSNSSLSVPTMWKTCRLLDPSTLPSHTSRRTSPVRSTTPVRR